MSVQLGYRYADRPLSGGTTKNRSLAVDFNCMRLIEGEIDRRRSIEGEKWKKRKRSTSFPRVFLTHAIAAHGSPARVRRPRPLAIFLPRKETERLPHLPA
ncbi:hypothetical protein BHM03_00048604 [Ensete ventricosum]|nr:hypothetical protein BHM03_00048604 [Ensete ventricosum]